MNEKLSIRQCKYLHVQPVQTLQPQNSTPPCPIASQLTRMKNRMRNMLHPSNLYLMSAAIACIKSSSDSALPFYIRAFQSSQRW